MIIKTFSSTTEVKAFQATELFKTYKWQRSIHAVAAELGLTISEYRNRVIVYLLNNPMSEDVLTGYGDGFTFQQTATSLDRRDGAKGGQAWCITWNLSGTGTTIDRFVSK
jgi:hypothetical protein